MDLKKDARFMHFWNDLEERTGFAEAFHALDKLRAGNPVAALVDDGFDDWAGLGGFLCESNTKLALLQFHGQQGAFKDKSFLKAALCKLECFTLWGTALRREKVESLCAAFDSAGSNTAALVLRKCDWEEAIPDLVRHLKRLQIVGAATPHNTCKYRKNNSLYVEHAAVPYDKWKQLGEALKLPSSTVEDLSLGQFKFNCLDWLADAVQSQHCKLRRLAFKGVGKIGKELVQVLQSPLEGFDIEIYDGGYEEEVVVEALKASSSLWFLQITLAHLTSRMVHEAILKVPKISHVVIEDTVTRWSKDYKLEISIFTELLGSPDCRLQSFRTNSPSASPEFNRYVQKRVLNRVEDNYHSQLQELYVVSPWQSRSLEVRCSNLLYRNSLAKDIPRKFLRELSQPQRVLKLFMCGHTGVGKTTIATNLLRPSAIGILAPRQYHASTQGISLKNLDIGHGKTLVIFDLAGQEVYHAFHHYFVRRSENDIFLIVCKVDKNNADDPEEDMEKLQRLLRYWLRFIVSHQSAHAKTRPTVFVALNRFCKRSQLKYDALQAANDVLKDFSTKVSIMEPALEVVARKPKQLLELKKRLQSFADTTSQHLPPVPKICNELIEKKARKWGRKTILQLQELRGWLPEIEDGIEQINALKFTMICLHNMGEAIYFGYNEDAAKEEMSLANHVILDVQWFVQDIIGQFIPQLTRANDHDGDKAIISTNPLYEKLRKLIAPDQKDPEKTVITIVQYLQKMGVIIPHWETSHKIIIPMLLKNKFTGWQEDHRREYRYWGRRMQPPEEDSNFTLLPSGVFSIIQADVAKLCKAWDNLQSFSLGDGWISFHRNSVRVLVLVGGENQRWTDRRWVDIMLMVLDDNIRFAEAERILSNTRDCILNLQQACPFLRIEEHVLNPKQVKAILHGASNIDVQAKFLDRLMDMAEADGLDFHYAWDPDSHSSVGELLMLSELKQLVQSRQSVVDDFNNIIAPVYELKQSSLAMPEFADPEMRKAVEYLAGILQEHSDLSKRNFERLELRMGTVLDTLGRLEYSLRMNQEQNLINLSPMLRHIQVPKFPYFTDEKNFFFKYSSLAGRQVWVHYMCESTTLKHPLDHNKHEGVAMTIAHEWIRKYKNVLIPAITVSFFIAKLGSTFTSTPVKYVLDVFEKGLKSSLDSAFHGNLRANINSCFGESVDVRQPAQHEVEELLDHVKKAAGEQNLPVLMAKHFGLFFQDRDGAWVCEKHRL